ncbi:hypothetical protein DFH08DRAFT_898282 [Mycena albidolilacea]|uniref:Uncharacterized protein n=1 Tax=Mycena albidolilacea TaxID=1033008 RepID=A0AAD7ECT0_9AGAR|nr:hypothetical protein DFH08DRAFT_898282 [Mycena albidolilacea]
MGCWYCILSDNDNDLPGRYLIRMGFGGASRLGFVKYLLPRRCKLALGVGRGVWAHTHSLPLSPLLPPLLPLLHLSRGGISLGRKAKTKRPSILSDDSHCFSSHLITHCFHLIASYLPLFILSSFVPSLPLSPTLLHSHSPLRRRVLRVVRVVHCVVLPLLPLLLFALLYFSLPSSSSFYFSFLASLSFFPSPFRVASPPRPPELPPPGRPLPSCSYFLLPFPLLGFPSVFLASLRASLRGAVCRGSIICLICRPIS